MISLSLSRSRFAVLVAVLVILDFIFAGMNWFAISMSPDQKTVQIQAFDGYTTYPALTAGLSVALIAFVTSFMIARRALFVVLLIAAVAAIATASLTAIAVASKNIAALRDQIERATGIAATHGLSGVEVSVQQSAWVGVACLAATSLVFVVGALSSRTWASKKLGNAATRPGEARAARPDAIGLWDSQR